MNILVLGSGGREHAICWKLIQSNKRPNLYIAPGNAGTAAYGENISISLSDFEEIGNIVLLHNINMVIVGPEEPLVNGIHDYFLENNKLRNIPVIGPTKAGARLEGSKDFAKSFMKKHNIPTAKYESFDKNNIEEGYKFLQSIKPPYVLKADGLAAGKGVVILNSLEEAKKELSDMIINSKFGNASQTVVIEEFLNGIELSVFVVTDGKNYKILPEAKDYKKIGEGDKGLNTGGMGAVSPVPFANKEFIRKVEESIVIPTIKGLNKEKITYKGFLFIGLMNVDDNPFVIEYNVCLGDPETEVVLPRIKTDLIDILSSIADNSLDNIKLEIDQRYVATVMNVSKGYPEKYEKWKRITGLSDVNDSIVYHAGTILNEGNVLTSGGRVLAITSYGENLEEALRNSYKSNDKIYFEGKTFRRDIGFDLK